jgi:hypothetical protein
MLPSMEAAFVDTAAAATRSLRRRGQLGPTGLGDGPARSSRRSSPRVGAGPGRQGTVGHKGASSPARRALRRHLVYVLNGHASGTPHQLSDVERGACRRVRTGPDDRRSCGPPPRRAGPGPEPATATVRHSGTTSGQVAQVVPRCCLLGRAGPGHQVATCSTRTSAGCHQGTERGAGRVLSRGVPDLVARSAGTGTSDVFASGASTERSSRASTARCTCPRAGTW